MLFKKTLICTKIDRYGDRYSEKSQPVPYRFLWERWAQRIGLKKDIIRSNLDNTQAHTVSYEVLWESWAVATESNHDIEYKFENISETHTKITPIYKRRGPDIVGELTYETRTDEGNRSEYAFYCDDMYDKYRRPLKMWPSGRPLVANKHNHEYKHTVKFTYGEGSTPAYGEPWYAFADFPNYQYEKEEIISEKEE
jgi:hypothetical protein